MLYGSGVYSVVASILLVDGHPRELGSPLTFVRGWFPFSRIVAFFFAVLPRRSARMLQEAGASCISPTKRQA